MIEYSGNHTDWLLNDLCEEYKHSDCKILIFEWWEWIQPSQDTGILRTDGGLKTGKDVKIDTAIKLIKEYDICFFFVREVIHDSPKKEKPLVVEEVKKLLNELEKLNVYYITLSTDGIISTNPSKTFNIPWFVANSDWLHIPENTHIDFDYRQKGFTFNMLLGSKKRERTKFFEMFGNEPYVYSTYFGSKKFRLMSSNHLEDEDILANLANQDITSGRLQTMQQVMRERKNVCISHVVPKAIYNNSHFDIVTETQCLTDDLNFTTEKTGKPIATGRFFIWYNSPNQIEYLRQFGFELQDYLSDYDSIIDNGKRLEAVIELIKEIGDNENYIKKIYEDTKEARMHNQEVFKKLSNTSHPTMNSWINERINRSYNAEKTNA